MKIGQRMKVDRSVWMYCGGAAQRWQRLSAKGRRSTELSSSLGGGGGGSIRFDVTIDSKLFLASLLEGGCRPIGFHRSLGSVVYSCIPGRSAVS